MYQSKASVRLLILAFVLCATEPTLFSEELPFRGKRLWSEETGFTVLPKEDEQIIAVTSLYHHYSLMLPYTESWVFETSKEKPLVAIGGGFSVSIEIVPRTESTARKKLKSILKNVKEHGSFEVRRNSFLDAHGRLALRYQVRFKDPPSELNKVNKWQYTYWTVIERDGAWYVLHLTPPAVSPPFQDAVPPLVEVMLGLGFRADFDAG